MENSGRNVQVSNSIGTQRAMIALAVLAVVAIGMIAASYVIGQPAFSQTGDRLRILATYLTFHPPANHPNQPTCQPSPGLRARSCKPVKW